MASYNKVVLAGYVKSLPVQVECDQLHKKAVTFELMIERSELNLNDILTIKAYDGCADRLERELKKGEYFVSESVMLRTTNYEKKIEVICPHCQTVETLVIPAEKTEIIISDYIMVPKTKVLTLLGINRCVLLGNICSELNFRTMNNGKSYLKYKLAVNREGWMKKYQHADYPFIVCFGGEAESGNKYLETSDLVLVEGAVQERHITQNFQFQCKECGNVSIEAKNSPVVEVIASNVEYLKGVKTKSAEEILRQKAEDEEAYKRGYDSVTSEDESIVVDATSMTDDDSDDLYNINWD